MISHTNLLQLIITKSPHLKWLDTGLCYLTLHGSRAYGTNTPDSDFDYKGICVPPKQYYLGSQFRFEQAELKEPDTAIYEIRKYINLAANANPNVIETLYTAPEDQLFVNDIGQSILDHRDEFLSKRIRFSFSGYAVSQLKRMQLHRSYFINPMKEPPTRKEMGLPEQTLIPQDQLMAAEADIQKEIDKLNFDFMEELSEPMKINIRNTMSEMLAKLKITSEDQWLSSARTIGLSDNFIQIIQLERAYKSKKAAWDKYLEWKKNRNPIRAAMEAKFGFDGKHGLHLIRLLRMCKEILSTGKVLVKRPDAEELLSIRNGAWTYEQIIEYADKLDAEIDELYRTSNVLPKTPDFAALDKLCIELVETQHARNAIQ